MDSLTSFNIKVLESKGIKAGEAVHRLLDNADAYFAFLRSFPNDSFYDKLLQAFDENNCQEAFDAAHTLRGTVGYISYRPLYELLVDMTDKLRTGDFESQKDRLPHLKLLHDNLCDIIVQVLGEEE